MSKPTPKHKVMLSMNPVNLKSDSLSQLNLKCVWIWELDLRWIVGARTWGGTRIQEKLVLHHKSIVVLVFYQLLASVPIKHSYEVLIR